MKTYKILSNISNKSPVISNNKGSIKTNRRVNRAVERVVKRVVKRKANNSNSNSGSNNNSNSTRKVSNHTKQTKKVLKMYKYRSDGDNTFTSNMAGNKDRCMCIDDSSEGLRRCTAKVVQGTDFCAKHANCRSKLQQFLSGYEPDFNPSNWKDPFIEGSHNCYSYFLNKQVKAVSEKCQSICKKKNSNNKGGNNGNGGDNCPNTDNDCTDLKPQPGDFNLIKTRGSDSSKERVYKCPNMEAKILADNKVLIPVDFKTKCPKNYYKGAMVVDPEHTFHFYRQDKDGMWSHKPGISPISRVDADKKPIYVPHFANRNYEKDDDDPEDQINYTDFCGYYCIPRDDYMDLNLA